MPGDKFAAVWVSHSSISDFLHCPRAYYLKNVYKDPKTGHKVALASPALSLGQSVHEVIESLSVLPTESRFNESLLTKYDLAWKKVTGRRGGFTSPEQEERYKSRGADMLRRVMDNPGPLKHKAVKIKMDVPHYWLSEADEIILCGKIDWLEYLPETDSVTIIDFKTGKGEESADSLQLPIYLLLVTNIQKRAVEKVCYWYLDRDNEVCEMAKPDLVEAQEKILSIAKQIKLARKLEIYKCPTGGCMHCKPFEAILAGKAELVATDEFRRDIYILPEDQGEPESVIL